MQFLPGGGWILDDVGNLSPAHTLGILMQTAHIREHYDLLSPYYAAIWDHHIHHGYFETGSESRSEATDKLIRLLLGYVDLPDRARVLDVGSGVGATSILFAQEFGYEVLGISISPEQVRLAREAAAHLDRPPRFEVQDANDLHLSGRYDLIWSVEMISHLHDRACFFARAGQALAVGGRLCIAAWLKESDLPDDLEQRYIRPIEEGMLVNLPTKEEYFRHVGATDLHLIHYRDISEQVAKTWEISIDLVKSPALWALAREHGGVALSFLKAFRAMKAGFASGCFRYAVMVLGKE